MDITSEQLLEGDILEREFTLDEIPGVIWTPVDAKRYTPLPLLLMGHPGDLSAMQPRLETRAREQHLSTPTVQPYAFRADPSI